MAEPGEIAEEAEEPAAEERFWRGGGPASAGGGTVPPEPGTTPAELDELESEEGTASPPS
jgi:hypothetical protein